MRRIRQSTPPVNTTPDPNLYMLNEISRLNQEIHLTNQRLKKANSTRFIIWTSVLRGLFSAIGATLVFAIVIFWADWALGRLDNIPIIDEILKKTQVETLFDEVNGNN